MNLKARLLGLIIIAVFAVIMYINWTELNSEGTYSIKMAVFGPLGIIGGLFVLLFPSKAGKPQTTLDKILVMLVFVIGILAGLVNWYLMDPGYFGR